MRRVAIVFFVSLFGVTAGWAQAEGDPKRGGQIYGICAACHSLKPGVHLSGPSLAGLWGKKAASVEGFERYSAPLKSSDLVWDENTLNAWLAHPNTLVPNTYMVFRGINDDKARGDLIAFLEMAMAPEGAKTVVQNGLIPDQLADGQVPADLRQADKEQKVAAIRRCRDTYFIKTADGTETPYWETNVRLKTDSSPRGPQDGGPVLVFSGMQGDRVSIVFSGIAQIVQFTKEGC